MDLGTVVASGATTNNVVTNSLVELSKIYGQVPSILENYFSSMDSFNYEVQGDRQQLRNMAEFAHNLSITKGRPLAFGDSEGNKNFANLVELHKELQKVGRLDMGIANLTEKEINDLNLDVGEYEKLIIEKWVSKTYPEQTVLDEKIAFMNNVIADSGTDFNRMMENFFEDEQEDGPWWGFGFVDTDLLTGNNEFNIMGRDKDLEPSFNLVMQEAGEQIFVRVASMFDNDTGVLSEFLIPLMITIGLLTRYAALGMIALIAVQTATDLFGHGVLEDPTTLGKWFDRSSSSVIMDQRLLWLFVLFYLVRHGGGVLSLDQWLSSRKV